MLCQNCGKSEATTHYHSVINGVVKDKYLCNQCAVKQKQINLNENDIFKVFTSFFNDGVLPNYLDIKCECCGTSYKDIQRTGKVGCGNCYNVFKEQLNATLQRIHGRATHIGKRPGLLKEGVLKDGEQHTNIDEKQVKIDNLKEQLKKAIETENYEKAAEIRDLIRKEEA